MAVQQWDEPDKRSPVGVRTASAGLPNKGVNLSERGSVGGEWPRPTSVMESRSAAYAQCWADRTRPSRL
jgi:hypothetical protein